MFGNGYQIKNMKEKTTVSECVKCIKELLKLKFPFIIFGIKTSNTIEGSSINITWTDGPTHNKIEELIGKYRLGEFDRNKNLYISSNFNKNIHQVNYITCKRIMSNNAFLEMTKQLKNNKSINIYDLFKDTELYSKSIKTIKIIKNKKINKSKVLDIDDFFEKKIKTKT